MAQALLTLRCLLATALVVFTSVACAANTYTAASRFIVAYHATPSPQDLTRSIADRLDVRLSYVRAMSGNAHVLHYEGKRRIEDVLQQMNALPEIRYAVREGRRTAQ